MLKIEILVVKVVRVVKVVKDNSDSGELRGLKDNSSGRAIVFRMLLFIKN